MIKQQCEARVTLTVRHMDGSLTEYPPQKNMLTDNALDFLLSAHSRHSILTIMSMGVGSDDTPNYASISGSVLSCSGVNLTASSPTILSAEHVGRVIQFDTNLSARIVSVTDSQHATLDTSFTFSGKNARVWATNLNALLAYEKTGVGDDGDFAEGVHYGYICTMEYGGVDNSFAIFKEWNTNRFDYPDAGGVVREVGWANSFNPTSGLFGRLVLETPVVVQKHEILYVKIELFNKVPIGQVTADPIFGLPGHWELSVIPRPYGSVHTPFLNLGSTSPLIVCADFFRMMIYNSSDPIMRDSTGVRTVKPYKYTYTNMDITGLNITGIYGYGFNTANHAVQAVDSSYDFFFDEGVTVNINSNQLLRIIPTVEIDRVLPPFASDTVEYPTSIAAEGATWDATTPHQNVEMIRSVDALFTQTTLRAVCKEGGLLCVGYGGSGAENNYISIRDYANPSVEISTINLGESFALKQVCADANYIYAVKGYPASGYPIKVYSRATNSLVGTIVGDNYMPSIFRMNGVTYRNSSIGLAIINGLTVTSVPVHFPYIADVVGGYNFENGVLVITKTKFYGIGGIAAPDILWKRSIGTTVSTGWYDPETYKIHLLNDSSPCYEITQNVINWNE